MDYYFGLAFTNLFATITNFRTKVFVLIELEPRLLHEEFTAIAEHKLAITIDLFDSNY